MTIDPRTTIWNRAAMSAGGATPGFGDQALSAVVRFHGMLMNGGIDHALDVLTDPDIQAAAEGFHYLGADNVRNLLLHAHRQTATDDDFEDQFDDAYTQLIPSDERLADLFHDQLAAAPQDFAPIDQFDR